MTPEELKTFQMVTAHKIFDLCETILGPERYKEIQISCLGEAGYEEFLKDREKYKS